MDAAPTPDGRTEVPPPRRRERLRRAWLFFRARYLEADPRTLGLARIVVGLLLCANAIEHWRVARLYYSNDGVLSNHYLLFRPSTEYNFSLFSAFSTPSEVGVAFACALVCHACFALGFHARIFAVLSLLSTTG
ncbi:MAG: hypothetical protein FJ095_20245 [Deltaproteobacteria bacterium]|nr:hypothetical protein [Deltaproteobacteria bacterium]